MYVVVVHLDSKTEPSDIKNGYAFMCAIALSALAYACLKMMSRKLSPLVLSAFLMLFQKMVLKVIIPIVRRCWGDDERKL